MWTLKEGKPYNPDYPDYFLSRVREEGIFDNLGETHSEPKENEQAHTVDVTVYFKGGTPAKIQRNPQAGRILISGQLPENLAEHAEHYRRARAGPA